MTLHLYLHVCYKERCASPPFPLDVSLKCFLKKIHTANKSIDIMMFFPFQRTCREGGSTFFIMMSAGVFVFQTACTPQKKSVWSQQDERKKVCETLRRSLSLLLWVHNWRWLRWKYQHFYQHLSLLFSSGLWRTDVESWKDFSVRKSPWNFKSGSDGETVLKFSPVESYLTTTNTEKLNVYAYFFYLPGKNRNECAFT